MIEYFRRNPQAIEQLRAPLYEDKVVDFILQMATVTEQNVPPEELLRDPDDDAVAPAAARRLRPAAAIAARQQEVRA